MNLTNIHFAVNLTSISCEPWRKIANTLRNDLRMKIEDSLSVLVSPVAWNTRTAVRYLVNNTNTKEVLWT
jgi:hypothetical protein